MDITILFRIDPGTIFETVNIDEPVKSPKTDGKVKSAKFKEHAWANLASRGVLTVRRSDSEVKHNAEIGAFYEAINIDS